METTIIPKFTLTRYLYVKDEVYHSLILSLFDKNEDESLFWSYELYFSGFQLDVFTLLNSIFVMYYEEKNPKLGKYLNDLVIEWDDSNEKHYILGKIIKIMLNHSISLTELMRKNPHGDSNEIEDREEEIEWQEHWGDVEYEKIATNVCNSVFSEIKFKTNDKSNSCFLKNVCRYPIRRYYCNMVIKPIERETILPEFWLYFASYTPLWKERIHQFHGIINHSTKQVTFNNEDNEECFHELYDYDVDEQSIELKERIWSTKKYTNISWKEFYDHYGNDSVFKKKILHLNLA